MDFACRYKGIHGTRPQVPAPAIRSAYCVYGTVLDTVDHGVLVNGDICSSVPHANLHLCFLACGSCLLQQLAQTNVKRTYPVHI
jgi:hypothetical protein